MAFDYLMFLLGGGSALLILFILYVLTYVFQIKSTIIRGYYNFTLSILFFSLLTLTILKLGDYANFETNPAIFGLLIILIPGFTAYIYMYGFTNISNVQESIKYMRIQSRMLSKKQLDMKGLIRPKEHREFGKIISNIHEVQKYIMDDYQTFLESSKFLSQALGSVKAELSAVEITAGQNNDLMMQIVDYIEPLEALIELETMDSEARIKSLKQYIKQMKKLVNEMLKMTDLTKVVAVNASIEAAQSGDIGGGFNLVADNVRTLANQSTETSNMLLALIREFENEFLKEYERLAARAEKMKIVVDKMTMYIAQLAAYSNNISASLTTILPTVAQTLDGVNQGLISLQQYSKIR